MWFLHRTSAFLRWRSPGHKIRKSGLTIYHPPEEKDPARKRERERQEEKRERERGVERRGRAGARELLLVPRGVFRRNRMRLIGVAAGKGKSEKGSRTVKNEVNRNKKGRKRGPVRRQEASALECMCTLLSRCSAGNRSGGWEPAPVFFIVCASV